MQIRIDDNCLIKYVKFELSKIPIVLIFLYKMLIHTA